MLFMKIKMWTSVEIYGTLWKSMISITYALTGLYTYFQTKKSFHKFKSNTKKLFQKIYQRVEMYRYHSMTIFEGCDY